MDSKLKHLLALRYTHNLDQLANRIAGEIHTSLDTQVVNQLGEVVRKELDLSEESWQLAGRLRQWFKRSDFGGTASALVGVLAVASALISKDLQVRLASSNAAVLSALVASDQRKTRREISVLSSTLAAIESAKVASELVRVIKPVKMVGAGVKAVGNSPENELKATEESERKIPLFNVHQLLEEATGIGLLGNSGSAKSCLAKLIAGALPNHQKLVLDPHDDPANSNWEGLTVLTPYELIAEQLGLLLQLLNDRDRTPLLIICDEWPAVRLWCKQRGLSIADDFLIRYGSEARKFEKLPLFCSQSGNTKALGLEGLGDFLENFALIRLNKIARKYAKNLSDQTILQALNSTAYCCLVGDEPHSHPTHGHHERVYKGAPPQGLLPLQSPPLTIPLAA